MDLTFRIVGFQPTSTNDMYMPYWKKRKWGNRKGKKSMSFRRSDALIEWQDFIAKMFEEDILYDKDYLYKEASFVYGMGKGIEMWMKISIPKEEYYKLSDMSLKKHDTNNFPKSIEDAIFAGLQIDDKITIRSHTEKGYNEDGVWYVEVHLKDTSIHNRIDVETRNAYIYKEE